MKHTVITIMSQSEDIQKLSELVQEHIKECQNVIKKVGLPEIDKTNVADEMGNVISLYAPKSFKRNGIEGLVSRFELADFKQDK